MSWRFLVDVQCRSRHGLFTIVLAPKFNSLGRNGRPMYRFKIGLLVVTSSGKLPGANPRLALTDDPS